MMWPFRSVKSLKDSGMFVGFTDWHSHILPGVDDGIKSLEESLEVLRAYENLGVKRIWLTPHIMEDYPNTTSDLKRVFEELKNRWNGRVELKLASENMLDSLFEQRLEEGDLLPIGDSSTHLLVETSYFNPPFGMKELLEKIKRKGYFPLLAHPERYRYMDEKDYRSFKETGIKFQINYTSLLGAYGETARKKAEWLLSHGMVDVVGSDLHRLGSSLTVIEHSPKKVSVLNNLLDVIRHQESLP